MSLYISEEFNLETFKAWSGGADRLDEIVDLGIVEEAQEYMEEAFNGVQLVTPTEINDLLWFGMDGFIECHEFAQAMEELRGKGRITLED